MKTRTILFILFMTNILHGQNIEDFMQRINYLDSDNTVFSYDFISKSGTVGLQDVMTGHGYLKKVTYDTLGYYHNILINYQDGDSRHQIYNGDYLALIMLKNKKCTLFNLDTFEWAYQLVTGNVIESYRPKFLFEKDYFKQIFTDENIEKLRVDTLNIFGRFCYRVMIKYFDTQDMNNNINYYYFDALSFYPIGYIYFFEYAGTKMERSFIIHNFVTSQNKDTDYFNYEIYKDLGFDFVYPNSNNEKKKARAEKNTSENNEFSLEKYKGKILMLDFGYISCPPCIQLIPVMEQLKEDYPEINIIGINPIDNVEKINKFVEIRNIKYPIYHDTGLAKKYNIISYPETIIYDKEGKIAKRYSGYSVDLYKDIKKTIDNLLK